MAGILSIDSSLINPLPCMDSVHSESLSISHKFAGVGFSSQPQRFSADIALKDSTKNKIKITRKNLISP